MLELVRFAFAFAVTFAAAFGQINTTGIHGIVRGPSGAVVPHAAIKVCDLGTGTEQSTVSSSEGTFAFANLQRAKYRLTATASGFQTAVYDNVAVDSGPITNVNVEMKLGATPNEVGATITTNLIQNLPYNGGEALSFALLMAGNGSANDSTGRNSTFNGLPNASMNITVDGMNNNSQRTSIPEWRLWWSMAKRPAKNCWNARKGSRALDGLLGDHDRSPFHHDDEPPLVRITNRFLTLRARLGTEPRP
uniref:Carboxypeptidase regulatory-like domain-containing protein n=1 Tax=Solibacter usitatus (strain Ellin6076) TaxID=234267 RepID=Q022S6_SOLUE